MNQIPNIEEEKTRCSCGRLVASPFSETVCSSFPFCQEEVGTFPNDPTGLRREFAIKFHRGDFIKDGEDNSELISDWFHQQLQKAREEERVRCIKVVNDLKQQWGGALDLRSAEFAESETKRRIIKNIV